MKKEHAFLDETFVVSSHVRERTNIVQYICEPYSEPFYHFYRMSEYFELSGNFEDDQRNLRFLSRNLKYVYPLTPKAIFQFRKSKYDKLVKFFNQLSTSEQAQFYVIKDDRLIRFKPGMIPTQPVELNTSLKPYYSKEKYLVSEIEAELLRMQLKLKKSATNAAKAGQKARAKSINYKLRKLVQISAITGKQKDRYRLYGRILKGVKSKIEVNGASYNWPKYVLGDFKSQNEGICSSNYSILHSNTVVLPRVVNNFPILEVDKYHLFCEKSIEAMQLRKGLSDHTWRKFRPFSHYEMKLSKEYPQKNSTGFPYEYFS